MLAAHSFKGGNFVVVDSSFDGETIVACWTLDLYLLVSFLVLQSS